MMASLDFWRNSTHFFGAVTFCMTKIARRTTTSERKQVFASNSKFQIESVRKQVTDSEQLQSSDSHYQLTSDLIYSLIGHTLRFYCI